jgi:hypothetical protein
MESVIIHTDDYFPNQPAPLHNLNEEFLEKISHGKILIYQVYK